MVRSTWRALRSFTNSGRRRKISSRTVGRNPEAITLRRWSALVLESRGHVYRIQQHRVDRYVVGAGHAEEAADTERELGITVDVDRAPRNSRPAFLSRSPAG